MFVVGSGRLTVPDHACHLAGKCADGDLSPVHIVHRIAFRLVRHSCQLGDVLGNRLVPPRISVLDKPSVYGENLGQTPQPVDGVFIHRSDARGVHRAHIGCRVVPAPDGRAVRVRGRPYLDAVAGRVGARAVVRVAGGEGVCQVGEGGFDGRAGAEGLGGWFGESGPQGWTVWCSGC